MMIAQHYSQRHEGGDLDALAEAMESAETISIDGDIVDDPVIDPAKTIYIDGVPPTRIGNAILSGQSIELVFTDSSYLRIQVLSDDGMNVVWGFKGLSVV